MRRKDRENKITHETIFFMGYFSKITFFQNL